MNKRDKIELAKTLYFRSDKTQKEICKIVGWSENSFTRHKTKEKWEEQKQASLLTKDQIISELMKQAKKISDVANKDGRTLTTSEVDSITKIASSIEKLSLKITLSSIVDTGIQFTKYILQAHGKVKSLEISDLFDEYIKYRLRGEQNEQ